VTGPGRWSGWLGGSSLDPGVRRHLGAEVRRHGREAARLLADGDADADGAERSLAAIERIERVLAANADGRGRVRLGLLVALGCLVLVSVAIGWRPGAVPVALDAEVAELTLALARPWQADGALALDAERLWLDGDLAMEAAGLDSLHDILSVGLERLPGEKGRLELRADGAEARTWLRLSAVGSHPSLEVSGGKLSGRIHAQGVRLAIETGEGGSTIDLDRAQSEVLRFSFGGHPDNPARLELPADKPWSMEGLFVDRLRFVREQGAQGRFVSTILGGSVRLLDLDSELGLHERDRLELGVVEGRYLRVDYEPKTRRFRVRFEGSVEQVLTGPDGFERNRAPTLLEYLYKQQQLALLWGAIVFLWGLFWGVRGWMRGS
jgi:hypothetical protein